MVPTLSIAKFDSFDDEGSDDRSEEESDKEESNEEVYVGSESEEEDDDGDDSEDDDEDSTNKQASTLGVSQLFPDFFDTVQTSGVNYNNRHQLTTTTKTPIDTPRTTGTAVIVTDNNRQTHQPQLALFPYQQHDVI